MFKNSELIFICLICRAKSDTDTPRKACANALDVPVPDALFKAASITSYLIIGDTCNNCIAYPSKISD